MPISPCMSHCASRRPVFYAERSSYAYGRPLLAGERVVLPASAASSSLADAAAEAVMAVDVWHHLGLFSSGLGQALRPLGRLERRGVLFRATKPFGPNGDPPAPRRRRPSRRWPRVTFFARARARDRSRRSARPTRPARWPDRCPRASARPRTAGRTIASSWWAYAH